MYTREYLIALFFPAQRPYWFISILPRNPIPFPYSYFPNPIPFPSKNIETEVEMRFFRRFSWLCAGPRGLKAELRQPPTRTVTEHLPGARAYAPPSVGGATFGQGAKVRRPVNHRTEDEMNACSCWRRAWSRDSKSWRMGRSRRSLCRGRQSKEARPKEGPVT